MCSWSFGENSLAHHLPRRESGGRKRTPLFGKACTSARVAGSGEGASQTPSPLKREQRGADGGEETSCHALAAGQTGPGRGGTPVPRSWPCRLTSHDAPYDS